MNLAARFNEQAFGRYESTIALIVSNFPEPTIILPKFGLSQETVAQRLRDAMRSLAENKWDTYVDTEKFEKVHAQIQIVQRGGDLIAQKKSKPIQFATQATLTKVVGPVTFEELLTLRNLIERGCIPGIEVKNIKLDKVSVDMLHQTKAGVAYDDDGTLRIIR